MDPEIALMKSELRRRIRAERRALTEEERRASAEAVAEKLVSLEELTGNKLILAYMPMKYELDIIPAVEGLKESGAKIAFPLCVGEGGLRLFVPAEVNGFVPGAYGILEPNIENAREVFPEQLDAIILPAIGFDKEGRRLGQGGGYYDRLLAKVSCFTAVVGFDCQLVPFIPTDETDIIVDIVVTPGIFTVV